MISVVILSKTASNLIPCVEAVRKCEPDPQIVVVDDGLNLSAADARAVGFHWRTDMNLVHRVDGVKPFVFARNANIGIKAAGNRDVVLLNDDALLETSGGFSLCSTVCADDPSIGIIGATTNVTGQRLQWRQNVGLRQVPHIAFVCVFIPRRTINRVGLLDERYCIDYGVEDRDYCEAVTRAGLKVCVHDGCYVDHGSLVSSFRGDPKTPRPFDQNLALFRKKWGHV